MYERRKKKLASLAARPIMNYATFLRDDDQSGRPTERTIGAGCAAFSVVWCRLDEREREREESYCIQDTKWLGSLHCLQLLYDVLRTYTAGLSIASNGYCILFLFVAWTSERGRACVCEREINQTHGRAASRLV